MTPYYIGVDLGTTAVKAILFDERGTPAAEASREVQLLHPLPGRTEQSPDCWYEIPCALIREIVRGTDPKDVKAIGISSQGITLLPVDEGFLPLSDGISWLDGRATDELGEILAAFDEDSFSARTGIRLTPAYTLPKLIWLKKHREELFRRAAMFLMPLDYLTARLCGAAATDSSMAGGTCLYEPGEGRWSDTLAESFGIPQDKLPPVRPTTALAGTLNAASQQLTGLTGDTLVAVGAQDQKIAAYGTGIREGGATLSLGTAGALEIPCSLPSPVLPSFRFTDGRHTMHLLEGCVNTFGAAIRWARDQVFCGLTYRDMDALAETAPPGSGGVRFYPHLSGVGTPHRLEPVRSGWTDTDLSTDRSRLIRALYEGLACEVRMNLDAAREAGAELRLLQIFGGGGRSAILCQIIADIARLEAEASDFTEAAAFGAAKAARACYLRETGRSSGEDFRFPGSVRHYRPAGGGDAVYRSYRAGQIRSE